ncbi:hypothetical protein RESH_05069 [Rhodopirellula europaea SH398]|uniref:Uncharacterized protein n=1 Tax=Rhodopirellula europaea SH398 TaxID=1263868 RepID=M5RYB9_9BACT|nr:hypothetical protein RESH_05069 [Rhodopirellula europaea SH398]
MPVISFNDFEKLLRDRVLLSTIKIDAAMKLLRVALVLKYDL